ncbi:MAG: cell division ATP-binding protein FtsE [Gammaproteobacteria bacterium]|nr:cell division ATP-binding protein FtsE [Gammaproteobacteria bacterium]MCF6230577.1 cell division ATP-binding protein FtsE [Gammaproteobacteria bacterium]
MIRFEKAGKRYPGGFQALENISFHLDKGEMSFLTGHSGAGKSTLLKLISAIEAPTGGHVEVNGYDLTKISSRKIPFFRREIGIIFQDYKLLYDRSVFDNVALPLIVSGTPFREVGSRVRAALGKVGLSGREKASPIILSGGEQQRVSIARAIVHRPPLLLADEPTGNLDPDLARDIMSLFSEMNQLGITTLIASHDWSLIGRMGKRVLHLEEGRLQDPDRELGR